MATRESANARGSRRSRLLRQRIGEDLLASRRASGLSLREVAGRVGVGHELVARVERGDPRATTIDLVARISEMVGLQLAASLHPNGDPVRDRGHLALLARFRARLDPTLRWRTEVPIPIAGDQRSGDGVITGPFGDVLVEAETHLADIQALERKVRAKARDLGVVHTVVLVADTRHNRAVIAAHPQLGESFAVDTRTCLNRLARGVEPGGDCLVIL